MVDDLWQRFRRRIGIGTVVGALAAVYIAVYLVQTIHHNYVLQKQIGDLQNQIGSLQDDKDTLRYQIQYYQSDAYKEKEARAKLGLQQPGEGVVILPHNDATTAPAPTKPKPKPKSNWQQWIDFLSGKSA